MRKYCLLVLLWVFLVNHVYAGLEIGVSTGNNKNCVGKISGYASVSITKAKVRILFDSNEMPIIFNHCSFTVIDKKKRSVEISGADIYSFKGCKKNDTCIVFFVPIGQGEMAKNSLQSLKPTLDKQGLIKEKNRKLVLVALDAGHGGEDPGTIGKKGTKEKDVNLRYVKLIESELKKIGFQVFLTRKNDTYLSLNERIDKAMAAKANFFISVHADSATNVKARGATVYTLSAHAINSATQHVKDRTNISGNFLKTDADEDLIFNILNIQHRSNVIQASLFGKNLLDKMKSYDIKLTSMPLRAADFAVLKAPTFPAILLELGYLSNLEDEKMLNGKDYSKKIAVSIAKTLSQTYSP